MINKLLLVLLLCSNTLVSNLVLANEPSLNSFILTFEIEDSTNEIIIENFELWDSPMVISLKVESNEYWIINSPQKNNILNTAVWSFKKHENRLKITCIEKILRGSVTIKLACLTNEYILNESLNIKFLNETSTEFIPINSYQLKGIN